MASFLCDPVAVIDAQTGKGKNGVLSAQDGNLSSGLLVNFLCAEKIINFLPVNFGVLVLQQAAGVRTARFYPNCTTQNMPRIKEA